MGDTALLTAAPPEPAPAPALADVLHRVATTVNSSLDVKTVLERLANITLEAIPAERCTLFLVDSTGSCLEPTLSLARTSNDALWRRFRSLPPIDLREVPERWAMFQVGRVLAVDDLARSPIAPPGLAEAFEARATLLAPLSAGGVPVGLLVLDWRVPDRIFPADELALVEAIAAYASLAVRNARLYQAAANRARVNERLVDIAAALNSSSALRPVLDLVCAAFEELLDTSHCSVNLITDRHRPVVQPLAVRGIDWLTSRPDVLTGVDRDEVTRIARQWTTSSAPVVYRGPGEALAISPDGVPTEVRSAALFVLKVDDELLGCVATAFPHPEGPSENEIATGQALADLAASALARTRLHDHLRSRVQQLEVLYRLTDVVTGSSDLTGALEELNESLRLELGVSLAPLVVANAQLRRLVSGVAPSRAEMEAIRSWRATLSRGRSQPSPRPTDEGLLVPVVHLNKVHGALRVTVHGETLDDQRMSLLYAVASGCAEVIANASLRQELADRETRLVVAAERERIARDLHDSVGQVVTGIGLRMASYLPEAPDRVWRERIEETMNLAATCNREVRQAIYALLFLETRRHGLLASLRELLQRFEAVTGIGVRLQVRGEVRPLPPQQEEALFRVAHEALMNVERHARAAAVRVRLVFDEDGGVRLVVRDDGVGLGHRDPFGAANHHFGLRSIQRRIEEAGGQLRARNAHPRGVVLEAEVAVTRGTGSGVHSRRSR